MASNRLVAHANVEEERAARETAIAQFLNVVKSQLPALMESLSKVKDPRNPKKITHQLTMVLFYGITCFVLQAASRREANRELSGPVFLQHLRQLFPDLDRLPHQDTLNRVLAGIDDVEALQATHLAVIRRLIRNKKFNRWLIDGFYPIAVDGTQKLVRRDQLSPEWLQRRINAGKDNERTQYYVYVLEAQLVFANGLTLPLMTEFLNYEEGDTSNDKQDCETRAFKRLAVRLKRSFPKLPIMLLLDGLYANGPILKTCRDKNWQFMIVLKDESLPSVWEEYKGLQRLEPDKQAHLDWANRRQHFHWANRIEYRYGTNQRKKQIIHVVVCEEQWEEIDENANRTTKTSRHAWLSSEPLTKKNLHERCNLGARHRWGIEEAILVEKHHGYQYEHLFSFNWNAMKGYHYLMNIGLVLNALARYAEQLYEIVATLGVRAFIKYVRDSLVHPWLDPERLHERLHPEPQLRIV